MPEISLWIIFAVVIIAFLAIDLLLVQRRDSPMRMRGALGWVVLWITLGLSFGALVLFARGSQAAGEYLAGYLIEYSLSVDNIFVFAMLFGYFAVPAEQQRRLLFWGVLGAIVFRAVFVVGGIALIHAFEPVIYVFGVLLIVTGIKMGRSVEEEADPEANAVLRMVRRILPVSERYEGGAFFVMRNGRRVATPLFAALVTIELSDIMFAVDSVPAILAITTDPFIVLTSNAFAILGLRSLYFVLSGLLDRFIYLRYGLALILVFAGAKMLLADVVDVPIGVSLGVIAGILVVSLMASLVATRAARSPEAGQPAQDESQERRVEDAADKEIRPAQ